MNGLLDFIKTPEGQGLLSAAFGGLAGAQRGAPLNSIGRAGLAGLAGYSGALDRQQALADNEIAQQYKQAQIEDLKRKQADAAKREAWLQSLTNPAGTALAAGASSGDIGPTVTNAGRMDALSGIPAQAIQADVMLNNGKNIPEWMFKRGTPDMQVSNGYAFDKNRVQPGFLPGMTVSNDGKATQTVIGPDGKPSVVAPAGALDTYSAYLDAAERAKAGYDLVPVPQSDGSTRTMPRSEAVRATSSSATGNAPQNIATKGNAFITPELYAMIQADAAKNGVGEPVLNFSSKEPGAVFGIAGPQLGVSQSPAAAAAEKASATADEGVKVSRQKDRETARKFMNQAKYAEDLLTKDPTGSGLGAMRDNLLGFFGQSTKASETAKQLEAVAGWLVSNVPRMEGPQSNFDVDNYMRMAGAVGDKTKPVSERLAALRTIQQMMNEVMGNGQAQEKSVVRKGRYNGRTVVQYSDGSMEYAD